MREHLTRHRLTTLALVITMVLIIVVALLVAGGSRFGGTDSAATAAIAASSPHYEPWFRSVWKPRSAEVESGLFALQAALGAGLLGFILGTLRERRRSRSQD